MLYISIVSQINENCYDRNQMNNHYSLNQTKASLSCFLTLTLLKYTSKPYFCTM